MDNFRFSTLEYKRPDLDAYRAKLKDWKAAIEHAESYEALRTLLLEMDRENCEPVSYTHLDVYKRQLEHGADDVQETAGSRAP